MGSRVGMRGGESRERADLDRNRGLQYVRLLGNVDFDGFAAFVATLFGAGIDPPLAFARVLSFASMPPSSTTPGPFT